MYRQSERQQYRVRTSSSWTFIKDGVKQPKFREVEHTFFFSTIGSLAYESMFLNCRLQMPDNEEHFEAINDSDINKAFL